jgi:hypothetical protein
MTALKEETQLHVREKSGDDISFTSKTRPSDNANNKKIKAIIAGVVVLVGIATAVAAWYFLIKKKEPEQVAQTTSVPQPKSNVTTDTLKKENMPAITQKPDSIALPVTAPVTGSYTFKIMFKVTNNKAAAIDKMNTLVYRGHKVIMYTADSVTYKLAEPFTLPLSDTAKIKDSLNRFYYLGKAKVELN